MHKQLVSSPSYRAEIDGLRAIAVISVILYHAKFYQFEEVLFKGGFLGVDIFFAISGYLITRNIVFEWQRCDSFNFKNFYERRARRLLPVLFLVIATSIPVAWKILLPSNLVEYVDSILAASFFGSNFLFYFRATEYGADSALLEPFLHTWSLGVEEQFYLVFPIMAIAFLRLSPQRFPVVLLGLCILSFLSAGFVETRNSDLNFYSPLSRFWELGVGSLLACTESIYGRPKRILLSRALPALGLALILCSFVSFNSDTPHPSLPTILPIIGAALLISFSSRDELVGKLLASKPMVWIGLRSYSAYLWHFPIFSFSRIDSAEPGATVKLGLIAATIFLSALSYALVERPFRSASIVSRRAFAISACSCAFFLVLLGLIAKQEEGFPTRWPQGWINFERDNGILRENFWHFYDVNQVALAEPSNEKVNVYIFGNSHSGDVLGALFTQEDAYSAFHFLKVVRSEQLSCFDERDSRFASHRSELYNSDAYKRAQIFVIASRFIDARCDKSLKTSPTDADGLSFLIPRLKKDGKKIIVLGNTLALDRIDGKWLAEKVYSDAVAENIDFNSFETFNKYKTIAEGQAYQLQSKENLDTNDRLKEFASQNSITYFDRRSLFCDEEAQSCMVFDKNGYRLRYDYGHLTMPGKQVFGELLKNAQFPKVLAREQSIEATLFNNFSPY